MYKQLAINAAMRGRIYKNILACEVVLDVYSITAPFCSFTQTVI